jgi:fatty acid desaturase
MGRIEYTRDTLLRHQLDIVRVGRRYPRPFRYFLWMKLPLYGLVGVALWLQPLNTVLVVLVPGLLTLVHTIWATYEHHAGCGTHSHLEASVNRTNPLYNRLTGNLGYHTAHHMRPGLHWSLLPKLHAEIAHELPSQRGLRSFW